MNIFFRPVSNIENNININFSSLGQISSRLLDFGQCRSFVAISNSQNLKVIHFCREEIRDEENGNKISFAEKSFKILVTGAILTGAVTFSPLLLLIPITIMAVKAIFHFSNTFISIDNVLNAWINNSEAKGFEIVAASRIKTAFNTNSTKLDLSNLCLAQLPSCIDQLSNLTSLDLGNNALTTLHWKIFQLSKLTSLYLGNNELASLPSEIGQLSNLNTLNLSHNKLTRLPTQIDQLPNLTTLNLSNNKLTRLPTELGSLSNLTTLNLSHNANMDESQIRLSQISTALNKWIKNSEAKGDKIKAASCIKEAFNTNSEKLDLNGLSLTEFPSCIGLLSKLTQGLPSKLTSLDLGNNELASLPSEIGQLSNLIDLDLSNNALITIPSEIGQLSKLTTLNLAYNKLVSLPPEIGSLSKLTTLNLGHNANMEEFQIRLSQILTSLDQWIKNSEAVGDKIEAASRIKEAFNTNSEKLDLSGLRLTELPSCIGLLSKLNELCLMNNELVSLPQEIGQLSNLTVLNLFQNKLVSLPKEIGQLSKLIELVLTTNKLVTLPSEIGQLSNLIDLHLSHNALITLPSEIGKLSNLSDLNLSNNALIALPSEIGQLSNLSDLNLSNNALVSLPKEIRFLSKLAYLNVDHNKFIISPLDIGQLSNLKNLN